MLICSVVICVAAVLEADMTEMKSQKYAYRAIITNLFTVYFPSFEIWLVLL